MLKNYFSLVKIAHTVFALPFAIIGYCLALMQPEYSFSWIDLGFIVLCMFFARNTAMGFNRWADRKIDARNPRTANRDIPAGRISPRNALIFTIFNAIAFMLTCWFINRMVFYLSPVAILTVMAYSYTKRWTALCHFFLGLALSLAPIGAYLTITEQFAVEPLIFSLIVLLWTAGFDIIYALPDEEFDIKEKLHSIPQAIGRRNAMMLSIGVHVIVAALVIFVGYLAQFHWVYFIGAALFIALLTYQHLIISPTNLRRLNAAFFTSNGVASLLFACTTVCDLYFFGM